MLRAGTELAGAGGCMRLALCRDDAGGLGIALRAVRAAGEFESRRVDAGEVLAEVEVFARSRRRRLRIEPGGRNPEGRDPGRQDPEGRELAATLWLGVDGSPACDA